MGCQDAAVFLVDDLDLGLDLLEVLLALLLEQGEGQCFGAVQRGGSVLHQRSPRGEQLARLS